MGRLGVLICFVMLACASSAAAQSAPDAGVAWAPPPLPPAKYAVGASVVERVPAANGEQIHVETWLPAERDGVKPPARVPVVADISPYHLEGTVSQPDQLELLVPRGFAYSTVHVKGTGGSTGCYTVLDSSEADDSARAIEYLGKAPFSTGSVGLIGKSNEGGQQLNVAGRGDRDRLEALKAIVPVSPVITHYDWRGFDGVPIVGSEFLTFEIDTEASYGLVRSRVPSAQEAADRTPCRAPYAANAADPSGVPTAWDHERELRRFAGDIEVPVLFTSGLYENQTRQLTGLFDRIDPKVKKVGLFGQWRHDYADENYWVADWSRADWGATVVAWFDRWLRGEKNGVDGWPTAQVQDTSGQWRIEPDFPLTGGPAGQLALDANGALGAANPAGSDVIQPFQSLTYTTAPLTSDLRITGVPVLDLWVQLDRPAGRLMGELAGLDAAGNVIARTRRIGARSLLHLDPLVENRFAQTEAKSPPVGEPLRVPVRFEVGDLVLPKGSRLRLTIGTAGMAEDGTTGLGNDFPGLPDPNTGPVTVLHDCEHVSALRFLMPQERPELIDVREVDQTGTLGKAPTVAPRSAGLAAERVCGEKPERLKAFGRRAKPRRLGDAAVWSSGRAEPRLTTRRRARPPRR